MLTKGLFTSAQWDHLLQLAQIVDLPDNSSKQTQPKGPERKATLAINNKAPNFASVSDNDNVDKKKGAKDGFVPQMQVLRLTGGFTRPMRRPRRP